MIATLPFDHAVRNLGRRPVQTLLVGAGAFVVALLALGAAGFVRGMNRALALSGEPDNAILLSAGSEDSVERSEVDPALAGIVEASLPQIRRRAGVPFVSPEVQLGLRVGPRGGGGLTSVRGVTDRAFLVHPRVRVALGRLPVAGSGEIAIGRALAAEWFDGAVEPGRSRLEVDGREHRVVAVLEAGGTVVESEVWAPLSDLLALARRDQPSCVVLSLEEPAAFGEVEAFAFRRLDLEITALRESDYYRSVQGVLAPIRTLGIATALLIALAALLGGVNTLYAAFGGRVAELAAMQVIGFRRRALAASLVQEVLVVHAAGGLLAAAFAQLALDGLAVPLSTGSFGLAIDPVVVAIGIGTALGVGLLGAIPPAVRALRVPIRDALRSG